MWSAAILAEQATAFHSTASLPVTFQLPADEAFATQLTADSPVYWELDISAETPGVDFAATYLIPVYS